MIYEVSIFTVPITTAMMFDINKKKFTFTYLHFYCFIYLPTYIITFYFTILFKIYFTLN